MMRCKLLTCCLLLLGLSTRPSNGYKMLVSTVGVSASQNLLLYRLADMLAQRGHAVTMLKLDVLPEAKAIKLKNATERIYPLVKSEEARAVLRAEMGKMPWEMSSDNPLPLGVLKLMASNVMSILLIGWTASEVGRIEILGGCENLTLDTEFVLELKSANYDVVLYHLMDLCTAGLTHAIGVDKYVMVSTAMMMEHMAYYSGTPFPPSWVPSSPVAASPPLNIFSRAQSLAVDTLVVDFMKYLVIPAYTSLFRKAFGEEYPDMSDIMHNTSLYFVNADPFFEYPRPLLHNVIYMGGITMQKPEALEGDWAKVMESAPKGVVLFSLGSVVNTTFMPHHIKMAFLEAFQAFPDYTFIWRLEGDFPEAKGLPNLRISTWLPQKDLLGHPKMKAFITHGGYNSLTEATYMGVPLIMFPLFGDQYANVARVNRLGVGVVLDKATVSKQTVIDSLKAVLTDHKVDAAARKLGKMIRGKPISSYDQAMKWTEFLAEFGPLETLFPDSRGMDIVRYYMLDVVGMLALGLVIALWMLWRCLCFCCCRRHSSRKPKRD